MNGTSGIPFLDLVSPHQELSKELCGVFQRALATAGFIGGPEVEAFEREFGSFCQTSHCVGVSSGTDALRFALMAVDIRPGDVVITVPNSFIATVEAISQAGGPVDFVDVDPQTYTMDPEKLREYFEEKCYVDGETGELISRKYNQRVAAVVPVHLYGQTADMDPILLLAERFGLTVI